VLCALVPYRLVCYNPLVMRTIAAYASDYKTLRQKVRDTLLSGQERIERQKVLTYWQTGKLINDFVLQNTKYAERGSEVISRLSSDLKVSERTLYEVVQFARAFPKLRTCAISDLSWAHFRKAATIPDEKRRLRLIEQAKRNEWTARDLATRVTQIKSLASNGRRTLGQGSRDKVREVLEVPVLGPLYTYKLITSADGSEKIDLGFDVHIAKKCVMASLPVMAKAPAGRLKQSQIKITAAPSYTYQAYVERVIDGDTLVADIDLGAGITTRQKLRLSCIDCPEIDTVEGKRAKAFVLRTLTSSQRRRHLSHRTQMRVSETGIGIGAPVPGALVTIKSTKDDKYGRYLADIFYSRVSWRGKPAADRGNLAYLNQQLLDENLARRV